MPQIHFLHKDGTTKTLEAPVGLSVMEIAVKNGIAQIEGACGGSLACATCHVYVHPDWWEKVLPNYVVPAKAGTSNTSGDSGLRRNDNPISDEENDMLDLAFDIQKTSRLSCQIIMRDDLDGLVLALPGARPGWV